MELIDLSALDNPRHTCTSLSRMQDHTGALVFHEAVADVLLEDFQAAIEL